MGSTHRCAARYWSTAVWCAARRFVARTSSTPQPNAHACRCGTLPRPTREGPREAPRSMTVSPGARGRRSCSCPATPTIEDRCPAPQGVGGFQQAYVYQLNTVGDRITGSVQTAPHGTARSIIRSRPHRRGRGNRARGAVGAAIMRDPSEHYAEDIIPVNPNGDRVFEIPAVDSPLQAKAVDVALPGENALDVLAAWPG